MLIGAGVALFLGLLLPTEKLPLPVVGVFAGEPVEAIDLTGGARIELRIHRASRRRPPRARRCGARGVSPPVIVAYNGATPVGANE